MKKLLVTGASGFLGWNLCQVAQSEWEVYGTYHSHAIDIPGVTLVQVDLNDFQALKELCHKIQPSGIIHTAAQSKPDWCQAHREEAYAINVTASLNLAGICADLGIPCVFTSTDLVFDGSKPPYKESDPVSPLCVYGEQKIVAEQGMRERYPQVAICRMPLMFGIASPTANSSIQPFIKSLREGKEIRLFTDIYRTPANGTAAVKGLLIALEKVQGVIHLGGRERISRYDFGLLMAEVLGLPQDKILPCQQKEVQMLAPRSPDTSLDSSKAFALGYNPLSLRAELESLRGQV